MQEVFAPLNASGDREGLVWSPEGVKTPTGFKEAYAKFVEAGWQGLNADVEYGGAGFPESAFAAAAEFETAANGALTMCPGLTTGAIECLQAWGTEEQKEVYLRKLITGEWTGTMNLTEPQAGSDVGLCPPRQTHRATTPIGSPARRSSSRSASTTSPRTSSTWFSPASRGSRRHQGHLAASSFPSSWSTTTVPSASATTSTVSRSNTRWAFTASPTCVMSYGDAGGAVGYLVGQENQGLRLDVHDDELRTDRRRASRAWLSVKPPTRRHSPTPRSVARVARSAAIPRNRRSSSNTPTCAACCCS